MHATQHKHLAARCQSDVAEQTESAAFKRVLRVAENLFLKKGYNSTTIQEIAAASKVSNATIVKYFGGKAELFICMVSEVTKRLINATTIDFAASTNTHHDFYSNDINFALNLEKIRHAGNFSQIWRIHKCHTIAKGTSLRHQRGTQTSRSG
jgi:AcrR family transcriptional regulator